MNSVKAIQPNNIFRVNPINLFENKDKSNTQLNGGLFSQQSNQDFSPNHPKVAGNGTQARFLDLLA